MEEMADAIRMRRFMALWIRFPRLSSGYRPIVYASDFAGMTGWPELAETGHALAMVSYG